MKFTITRSEEYPVFNLIDFQNSNSREIPNELVARYEAAKKEWDEVQKLLYAELIKEDKT